MNATQLAKNVYDSGTRFVRTPRGIEYEAFARVTSRLKTIATQLARAKQHDRETKSKNPLQVSGHFAELSHALLDNRKLWTILASDVANRDNGLPKELCASIFSLAEFTRQHTAKVLKSEASVVPLLEINIAIMRGLSNQSPQSNAPQGEARLS